MMTTPTAPKPPGWKRRLFFAAVLVGLPVTGWAMGEHRYWVAAVAGLASATAAYASFTALRCPNCRERLLTISYPATHCPKCGTAYS